MAFADILNAGRTPGEDGIPESIWDDLEGAHTDDVTIRDSAIAEKDAALEELAATLQRVQAHNYELLMVAESAEPNEESDADGDGDEDGDDNDGEIASDEDAIDEFWKVKED